MRPAVHHAVTNHVDLSRGFHCTLLSAPQTAQQMFDRSAATRRRHALFVDCPPKRLDRNFRLIPRPLNLPFPQARGRVFGQSCANFVQLNLLTARTGIENQDFHVKVAAQRAARIHKANKKTGDPPLRIARSLFIFNFAGTCAPLRDSPRRRHAIREASSCPPRNIPSPHQARPFRAPGIGRKSKRRSFPGPRAAAMAGSQFEIFLDQRVVAVAAIDAFGRIQIVVALQLDAGDVFHNVDQLVDADQLRWSPD